MYQTFPPFRLQPPVVASRPWSGFDLELTALVSGRVRVPVVASGGAGRPQHLIDVFTIGQADAAIIASIVHTGEYTIAQIKKELAQASVPVRLNW